MKPGKEYFDSTYGLRPGPNVESFNNVVYSTQYIIGNTYKASLDNDILLEYEYHITKNADSYGLYIPKNSHDNLTYKIIGSKFLGKDYHKSMNLKAACKGIGFRLWDWILYAFWLGSPLVRFTASLFLWIPALQAIESFTKKEKIRPTMFDKNLPRWKWWFRSKKLTHVQEYPTYVINEWEDYSGSRRYTRHMMNDGKHIWLFKLLILRKESRLFALVAKVCDNYFVKRYGEEYAYVIMRSYFQDQNHPNIDLFKGIKRILRS